MSGFANKIIIHEHKKKGGKIYVFYREFHKYLHNKIYQQY